MLEKLTRSIAWRNPLFKSGLIAGWSEQTVGAVAGRHVLAIQDTSDVLIATTQDHPPVKPGDWVWAKSAKAQGMAC
jgi:hypothetical protein